MNKLISFVVIALFSAESFALQCTRVGHEDGSTHQFKATVNTYTHIELPENIMQGTKPIIGNSELWTADHAGPHIYIKPTSEEKNGASTSLSAVGESGKSYDFKIVRTGSIENPCYKLADGVIFSPSQKAALSAQSEQSPLELASLWRDKYSSLERESQESEREAILEALRKYRYQIYTRYDWKKNKSWTKRKGTTKGFIGEDLVSDVYDDGRFTYIRVYNQNKGILMIEAVLEDQVEMIEAKYDPLTRMYTVSGIFPEFTLKYGSSEVKISRADSTTVGEY